MEEEENDRNKTITQINLKQIAYGGGFSITINKQAKKMIQEVYKPAPIHQQPSNI